MNYPETFLKGITNKDFIDDYDLLGIIYLSSIIDRKVVKIKVMASYIQAERR